jgi:hypothetical protein
MLPDILTTGWEMAALSEAAYKTLPPGAVTVRGYQVAGAFLLSDTQFYIFKKMQSNKILRVAVVFRGTEKDFDDILTDIDIRFYKGTHRGFQRAYESIEENLFDFLWGNYRGGVDLVFAGHSLGGAIAQVAAGAFQEPCYTFGSPRVWTSDVPNRRLPPEHYRFVYGGDVVPCVPFLVGRYRHQGKKIQLKSRWRLLKPKLGLRFKDHRIANYTDELCRLAADGAARWN